MITTRGMTSTHHRVPVPVRLFGYVLAAYLVVRAGVEFVTIDYGDPASYRLDWGGPSLLGVLTVHTGPGLLIAGYEIVRVQHRIRDRLPVDAPQDRQVRGTR